MNKSFSLVSNPWLPVVGYGEKSLYEIFSNPFPLIGGNPIEHVSIFKLLLAIAQSAITPKDEKEWLDLTAEGLAREALKYLQFHENKFNLYGPEPFLQMPVVKGVGAKPFSVVVPEIASGNTTVLTQTQTNRVLSDAELTLNLLTLQSFALGGKKTDNSLVLTSGYKGKKASGKPGCSLEQSGLLHTYVQGENIWETLWLNLWTQEQLETEKMQTIFPFGRGQAPWEKMPQGEDCDTAKMLKGSLLGRLVPLCRFCLIENQNIHLTEGIQYSSSKEGIVDTTASLTLGDKPKALLVNPMKRPWRELTAILSTNLSSPALSCTQLTIFNRHSRTLSTADPNNQYKQVHYWSGGLRVSNKAGEQFVSGSDDYVDSSFRLSLKELTDFTWFTLFSEEINQLNQKAKRLEKCIRGYCEKMKMDTEIAKFGESKFWLQTETLCQNIIDCCVEKDLAKQKQHFKSLHQKIFRISEEIYSDLCPYTTSKQLMAWTKYHPNSSYARKRG